MCGIAGIVGLNNTPVVMLEDRLKKMGSMLIHRGPDQEGFYISNDRVIGIFNNRLSIVGVEQKIKLPIRSSDENYVLSFNGEIYNHKELKEPLVAKGCKFTSCTDTEVLYNGLVSSGLDYLKYLDGMWSFAFIDQNKKNIYLSRDVLGEKPLYYYIGKKELIFSSEVAPILAVMEKDPEWDDEAIVCSLQYRSAPPGKTLIKDVNRLYGGETIKINYETNHISSSFYKQLNVEKWKWFFDKNPSLEEVIELYEQEIYSSCKIRLPSEVGFATTLSGGIDSTLVNIMLSKYGNHKLDAIHGTSSLISPRKGSDISEIEAARYTAQQFGINLTEFFMYDEDSLSVHQQEASDCFDGILCESSPSFRILAKQAKLLGKKVLVLSDGPDELLNGYDVDLRVHNITQKMQKFSHEKRVCIKDLALTRESWLGRSQDLLNWAYLNSNPVATRPNHGGTAKNIMSELISESYKDAAFKKYGVSRDVEFMQYDSLDTLQRLSLGYLQSSLPDYVNTRSDRGSMKEGVEVRLPFLSTSIVELSMSTPGKFRIDSKGRGKNILRTLVDKNIGGVISKRNKYGFAAPFWMIPGNRDKIGMDDIINSSSIFDRDVFHMTVRQEVFKQGNERLVWMAYSLAMTERKLKEIRV